MKKKRSGCGPSLQSACRLQALSENGGRAGPAWLGQQRWRTHKGQEVGGKVFTKSSLHKLLTNVLYAGQIKHKREVHAGEHKRLIAPELWQQVQDLLHTQAQTKGAMVRNRFARCSRACWRCVACGRSMTPSHAASNGNAIAITFAPVLKSWAGELAHASVAAPALEQVVLTQLRDLVQEASLAECLADEHWQTLGPLARAGWCVFWCSGLSSMGPPASWYLPYMPTARNNWPNYWRSLMRLPRTVECAIVMEPGQHGRKRLTRVFRRQAAAAAGSGTAYCPALGPGPQVR